MNLLLQCKLTNEPLGVLNTPYPSAFPHLTSELLHPAFDLTLFEVAKQLANSLKEDSPKSPILFLAAIHRLTKVTQDFPGLPSRELTGDFTPNLLTLVDWKLRVPSLYYPHLHISKANANFECLENWILTCLEIKNASVQKLAVQEALFLAELENSRTALSLSGNPSKTKLWNWISTLLMGTPYEADSIGWLRTLFLSKNAHEILFFDREEIIMGTEIIESYLPLGTGLGPSVRRRLKELRDTINGYYIDIAELDKELESESESSFQERVVKRETAMQKITSNATSAAPQRSDFKDEISYIVARSRFQLANRNT